jgi:low temperature requirement protein LtrA
LMAAMWWLYFCDEDHLASSDLGQALSWGYGHLLVFGSAAAVGAGFAVMVDILTDHAKIGVADGLKAIAIPLAVYIFSLWLIRDRVILKGLASFIPLIFAGLVFATIFLPVGIEGLTGLTILCVILRNALARRQTA